jgi:hypothetical protein
MSKTVLKDFSPMAKALFRQDKFLTKLSEIAATEILQFTPFEQVPHMLLRIEIRSVAWEAFEMQPLHQRGIF